MIIEYLFMLLGIPLGFAVANLTKDEKKIYSSKRYFPTLIWILGLLALISFFIHKTAFFTLAFSFVLIITWSKA